MRSQTNNRIPENIKRIYLMAICGTGMGTLAGMLKTRGFEVSGSDNNVYPPMSTELERQGISIFSPYDAENIKNANPDLVIVGNAISRTHVEAEYLLESDIPYVSMPEALNHFFLHDKDVIVVSGTHGKTTTTTLMSHLLTELGTDPSFLIGGVAQNFGQNYKLGKGKYFVIEGDEYDTSFFDKGPKFLHYNPKHVIMTSLEFDHADIYTDLAHIQGSFEKLAKIIPSDGSLHFCKDYDALIPVSQLSTGGFTRSYGRSNADLTLQEFEGNPEGSRYQIDGLTQPFQVDSPMSGDYNALNFISCFSVLNHLGFSNEDITKALQSFSGVKRRQEILLNSDSHVVIDDFAHHPTAIQLTIKAIREKFPSHHLVAIFEPRSNTSRTNVFQNEFNTCFDLADESIIAPVNNPEKVKDGKILEVEQIAHHLQQIGKIGTAAKNTDEIVNLVVSNKKTPLVALIMSNGGFDGVHQKIISRLKA